MRRFRELLRSDGLTEHEAVFDRRHVVQRLSEIAGDRLSADAIDALADELITHPELVELRATRERSAKRVIRRADGRVVKLPGERIYSTTSMLALERRALAAYERGREAEPGSCRRSARSRSSARSASPGFPRSSDVSSSRSPPSGMRVPGRCRGGGEREDDRPRSRGRLLAGGGLPGARRGGRRHPGGRSLRRDRDRGSHRRLGARPLLRPR